MIRYCLIVLALTASPAFAGDEPELTDREFIMPSRNIGCIVQDVSLEGGSGPSKRLFCVRNLPSRLGVMLDERGVEEFPTDEELPFSSEANVLNYGENWFHAGFSCDSTQTGLVCSHTDFGGFELARKGFKRLR